MMMTTITTIMKSTSFFRVYFFSLLCLFFISIFTHEHVECAIWEGISDEEVKHVKHLTHDVELQIYSQHTSNCIALFCNNKELKCKNVYKEFVKASNELVGEDIIFVYVDTLTLEKTADNFDIKSIPKILTFRDFDPEKGYTFSKPYTKENIIEWFKLLPVPSIEIMDENNVDKYVDMQKKKGYASIIAYCIKGSDNLHKFVHFGETHKLQNLSVGLVYVKKEEETKIDISNGPGVTVPNDQIKYKDTYKPDNNIWSSEEILNFASEYMKQFPIIINYSRKIIKPMQNDLYLYIYIYPGEYSDALYSQLYSVIKANPQVKFVFPKSEEITDILGIETHANLLCIMDYSNASMDILYSSLRPKKYIKEIDGNIKVDDVSTFLDDFFTNKITQFKKSQKAIKRREKQEFQILCGNNFESFVFAPEKIVLVFYHVEGCKECTPLFSFWNSVANYFHLEYKYEDILVATMDAKLNDMVDETIDFYPSVAIYPKGENKLRRRKFLLFPIKLDTLIDIVDELLEDVTEDL
ncbi:protein disulfide-isomerase PDI-Trans [Plasmodium brasilianum]|uniref:Protein disulfide isomerase, putative n=2 Tax=Plasmodium (Plasmodium) TaxID=418103 RepID=A0A1A8VTP6_PLAMA|nr:protein disulfide isomerase, putative [Plasmodium malariae]KAI4839428.1 protein disulfide-isomerase PDI-Trans [Plasmodium brasilianum]SBS83851.1 protein disulfide isomerase, putative [Plasmodium malariae]SBT87847.1 protein disulfide isomerase, putative [Plasmodium malariae]